MTLPPENWIGRTTIRDDVVTPRLVAEFRATLAPHLFEPESGGECPPGLHWGVAPAIPAMGGLGEDGAEAKGIFLPPVALPRRMWAGGRVETIRPLTIGAAVRRVSTVVDVGMREGKSGPLCFISVTHEISCAGALAIRERHDIVFRGKSLAPAAPAVAMPRGDLVWRIDPTPVLLFRFSAFTFNGHRIHYDQDYATRTEGYGGVLVHGPLQAALLLNQLSVLAGAVPKTFDYRCLAPLVAGRTFRVVGTGPRSCIVDADGAVTAEGRAL